MKNTKRLCLIMALVMLCGAFAVTCEGGGDTQQTTPVDTTTAAPAETTTAAPEETTTAAPETPEETTAPAGDQTAELPKSIKILAVGNSFSTDAMEYVYRIAKSAGVETVVLGNLYIGGCDLATHVTNARLDKAAYTYYKNTKGVWVSTKDTKMSTGIKDEEWDVITIQQSSKTSGVPNSYGKYLTTLVDTIEEQKTNPNARIMWHMTWAYQQDSTHSSFPRYDKDQTKMYNMIIDTVKECVLTEPRITGIIPNGTAIQNARTGFVGDNLTRDGYHLNKTLGRYIAGLCYFSAITGVDISNVDFVPGADITPEVAALAKDSVKDAIAEPYKVTQSKHTTGSWAGILNDSGDAKEVVQAADCIEADKALAAAIGVNLDNYTLLEYEYLENSYWYSTKKAMEITVPSSSGSTYHQNICTKKIYTKQEIPENSIIICDSGWQFRPEKWVTENKNAATRPGMVSAGITLLDAAFWGNNNFLAINIAADPKADISTYYAAAASHVRIYIPKS